MFGHLKQSGDLPWGLVKPLGKPVPDDIDPTTLPGAAPFFAYLVEQNDLHLTVYFPFRELFEDEERRRLFVAEESDAVYVALVFEPTPQLDDGVVRGWAGGPPEVDSAHVMLERPLAGRGVVDAVRCELAKQVRSEATVALMDWGGAYTPVHPVEPPPPRWWQRRQRHRP